MEEQAEQQQMAADASNSGADSRAEQAQTAPAKETETEPKPQPEPDYKAELERYKAEAERSRHAMARARKERAAEKAEWERKFAELEAKLSPAKRKTREDFKTDGEWQEYAVGELRDSIAAKVQEELRKKEESRQASERNVAELKAEVSKFAGPEADKVWEGLNDEDGEAFAILSNPRSKTLLEEVMGSPLKGALLCTLQKRPDIFRGIAMLTPTRQSLEIAKLERAIADSVRKAQEGGKAAEQRADSLPAVGSFGTNGRGSTDISGLSQQQRLDRYKADILKRRA